MRVHKENLDNTIVHCVNKYPLRFHYVCIYSMNEQDKLFAIIVSWLCAPYES